MPPISPTSGPENSLTITTLDEAQAAGGQVAALTIQINGWMVKKNRAEFAAQKIGKQVSELRARIARYETALREWANKNRKDWGESKSLELRHVILAFKLGRPAVRLLQGWTDALVLAALRKTKALRQYIRVKEEVNRQRISEDAKPEVGKLDANGMRKFGVEIAADEYFYVEPKLEQKS